MTPTTLYEYYKSKGQSLPSIDTRRSLYESSGLGSGSTYTGSVDQNTRLLAKLSGGGNQLNGPFAPGMSTYGGVTPPPSPTVPVFNPSPTTGSPTIGPSNSDFGSTLSSVQDTIRSAYQPTLDTYKDYANQLPEIYGEQQKSLEANIPLIQQRYKNLLAELEAKDAEAQAEIERTGNAAIGETRARSAARGVYSSSIEQGQEANIGANTARLVKSQAESTARQKSTNTTAQGVEEANIRSLIAKLATEQTEQGFKLREAIAKIGPAELESSISLAAKIMSEQRSSRDQEIQEMKLPYEIAKLKADSVTKASESDKRDTAISQLKQDALSGASIEELGLKYSGINGITGTEIQTAWNGAQAYIASNWNGPATPPKTPDYTPEQLYKYTGSAGYTKEPEIGSIGISPVTGNKAKYMGYGNWKDLSSGESSSPGFDWGSIFNSAFNYLKG